MKFSSLSFILLALCALLCLQVVEGDTKKLDRLDPKETEEESPGGGLELNPDYVQPESIEDEGDSDADGGSDSEEMEEFDDSIKGALGKAMATSRKRSRKTMKLVNKHRTQITLTLTVFAFRREIRQTLIHFLTKEVINPQTGKLRVGPTSALKFLLFVNFIRRIQDGSAGTSNPSFQALSALGQSNPFMGAFVSKFLKVPMFNPAYIPPVTQHYTFERVNERYVKDGMALHKAIHAKHEGFKWPTSDPSITQSIPTKRILRKQDSNETVIILDMTRLDQTVSTMNQVRDEISFLLSQYRVAAMLEEDSNTTALSESSTVPEIEIVILLESPGGSAADYGLAAQQLLRLRNEPGIKLTVCVDKVAASGGYMMACTASPGQLLAAPFAIVGSIGVLGQLINVHNLLEGWGISDLIFRGGKDKAPLGMVGEVTKEGKEKVQSMVDETHRAFKRHVVTARPILEHKIEKVGNGDIWIGYDALDLGLVDRITTSDEYICQKVEGGARVLKMVKNQRVRFPFSRRYDPQFGTRQGFSVGLGDIANTAFTKAINCLVGNEPVGGASLTAKGSLADVRLVTSRVENPTTHA